MSDETEKSYRVSCQITLWKDFVVKTREGDIVDAHIQASDLIPRWLEEIGAYPDASIGSIVVNDL